MPRPAKAPSPLRSSKKLPLQTPILKRLIPAGVSFNMSLSQKVDAAGALHK